MGDLPLRRPVRARVRELVRGEGLHATGHCPGAGSHRSVVSSADRCGAGALRAFVLESSGAGMRDGQRAGAAWEQLPLEEGRMARAACAGGAGLVGVGRQGVSLKAGRWASGRLFAGGSRAVLGF